MYIKDDRYLLKIFESSAGVFKYEIILSRVQQFPKGHVGLIGTKEDLDEMIGPYLYKIVIVLNL